MRHHEAALTTRARTRIRGFATAVGVLVVTAAIAVFAPAAPAGADPLDQLPDEDSHGITTTAWSPLDGTPASQWRYFTATVQTSAIYLGRSPYTIRVRVLVPPNYDPDRATPYDVLYLLHGGAANYASWTDGAHIKDVVQDTDFTGLVVMPEGGGTGYYTDWAAMSDGGFWPQWETFHIDQLLPWIDANFNTHRPGEQPRRLIAGVSMGGWGAAKYAGQHPDKFVAAAGISGGYDIRNTTEQNLFSGHMAGGGLISCGACILDPGLGNWADGGTRVNYYPPGSPWPDPNQETQKAYRLKTVFGQGAALSGQNPFDLAANFGSYGTDGSKFALYSGGNATGETDFYAMATRFHDELDDSGAQNHRFCTGPGNHADWAKWNYALTDFLELAYDQPTGACAY